ncbi:MAG TPA: PAS domain S-box protein, partial [Longimicrobiales bacterium]|nr:PAS domain S-box protein [Longimicrobiales bacterium]
MSSLALLALVSVLVAVASLALLGRAVVRQRQAEERLEIQKSYLDELFDTSDDPAILLGQSGRILRGNEPFLALLGHPASALTEMDLSDILVPDRGGVGGDEVLARVLRGEPINTHARGVRSDASQIELSVMGGPIRIPGEPGRAFLVFRDVTRQILVDAAFHRLEQAVDTMQLGVTVTDLEGTIIYTNIADAAMHGYVPEELVGRDVRILAPTETHRPMAPEETANRKTWRRESVNLRRDGTTFPVQLMSDLVRDTEGRPIGVVTTCEDITERKMAERALRESEERYARAMKGANDGLWDWDLESGEVFYSTRWKEIVGEGRSEIAPSLDAWIERIHPEDRISVEEEIRAHREGRTPRLENEHRIRHRDGSYLWVLVRGMADRDPAGRATRITGSMTDITERKGAEEQLAYEALYDPLTGLPNRAFLDDLLRRTMRRLKRQPEYTFAVLFLDLDRFKQINDTLGHATGDRVLAEVARRLQTCVRPGDVVARLAGDEFCVLLDDIGDGRDATRVARRVL